MKNIMKRIKNRKGFTLMEIIIVIAIIAILAVIAIPSITGYVNEAKEQEYISLARAAYAEAIFESETGQTIDPSAAGTYTADTTNGIGGENDSWSITEGSGADAKTITVKLFTDGGPTVTGL